MVYFPRFQDQINPFDPLGGLNCTTYAAGMAADYDSLGTVRPSGRQVRNLCRNSDGSPDRTGGTTLPQIDEALRNGWGIDLDVRISTNRVTWDAFVKRINAGQGAVLQGGYSAIHGTRFSGDEDFEANHAMFIPPQFRAMDSLCDGRRPGIYKFNGEPYPIDLLRRFAGALDIRARSSDPLKRLGVGYAWAAFTHDRVTAPPKYRAVFPKGTTFWLYTLDASGTRILSRREQTTGGFSADCEGPRWYPWLGHDLTRLVYLTEGARKGFGVHTKYADEI
jgi:hypothetical protein